MGDAQGCELFTEVLLTLEKLWIIEMAVLALRNGLKFLRRKEVELVLKSLFEIDLGLVVFLMLLLGVLLHEL